MILNALAGKPLPIYGRGDNVRDWLHVEDHCAALRLVLDKGQPGEVYNIGGECELTNVEVVTRICDVIDRIVPELPHRPCRELIEYVADRPGHDFRYAIDSGKIERELGWRPRFDFDSGLEQTIRWYLSKQQWVERVRAHGYDGQRLGLRA
jgi:dTDP-glucose 4,6-dehydratase